MIRLFVRSAVGLSLLGLTLSAEPITAVSGVFTVDRTPPGAPSAVTPGDGETVSAPFLRLEASAFDATSGVAGYEFELVGAGWQDLATSYAVFRDLEEGGYTWNVRARDAAGNWSDWASFQCVFAQGGDADADGLPDAWELACFGRLDYSDGTGDSDLDGIVDFLEAEADTHGFEFYLSLARGWNMVSLPCDTTIESAAALVAASASPVWSWNAAKLRYQTNLAPAARVGLWVFALEPVEAVPVSGTPPLGDTLRLERGWNLTGSGLPALLDSMAGIQDIMTWNEDGYELREAEDFAFELLRGYWVYTSEASDRALLFLE